MDDGGEGDDLLGGSGDAFPGDRGTGGGFRFRTGDGGDNAGGIVDEWGGDNAGGRVDGGGSELAG